MIIELTEEEREFLERVCSRAVSFAKMGISTNTTQSDIEKAEILAEKFKKSESEK